MKKRNSINNPQQKLRALIRKYGSKCFYCKCQVFHPNKKKEPVATIDHYVPLSKGGNHGFDNLRIACKECNWKKADSIPKDLTPKQAMKVHKYQARVFL